MKAQASYPYNLLEDITGETWETELDADQLRGLEHALETLTERERIFIGLRYGEGMTNDEIARIEHVTRERVRQICAKAVRKLTHPTRYKYITLGYERSSGELAAQVAARHAETIAMLENQLEARMTELRGMIANADDIIAKLKGDDSVKVAEQFIDAVNPPLEALDFSVRTYNCLARAGVKTISDIAAMDEDKLRHVRNLGAKSYAEVIGMLDIYGYTLRGANDDN